MPHRVRVSPDAMKWRLFKRVQPIYPREAQADHIEGVVVLSVIVDTQGNVSSVTSLSGSPTLVPAAIEAVEQWKYDPYLISGEPIEVDTTVEVGFAL